MPGDKSISNLCEVCKKREYTQLCDYEISIGFSSNFKVITSTCDKKLCRECAVNIWADCDVCPKHAGVVKDKLGVSK